MRYSNTPKGEMSAKDIMIVASIALGAAIIVLFAFILFSKQAPATDQTTFDRINEIQQRAAQQVEDNKTKSNQQQTEVTTDAPVQVFTGTIRTIEDPTLVLQTEATGELVVITLPRSVLMTYNGENFDRTKFLEGDQVRIQAEKVQTAWQALNVVVLFSSSPETPASVPEIYEERPDGTIKPLG